MKTNELDLYVSLQINLKTMLLEVRNCGYHLNAHTQAQNTTISNLDMNAYNKSL